MREADPDSRVLLAGKGGPEGGDSSRMVRIIDPKKSNFSTECQTVWTFTQGSWIQRISTEAQLGT